MLGRIRRLRRRATIAATIVAATLALAAPATSEAAFLPGHPTTCTGVVGGAYMFHSNCPGWYGWGVVFTEPAGSCIWWNCMRPVSTEPVSAWAWTANGWRATTLRNGSSVYMYPFATGWTWAWQHGAWYAVQADHVAWDVRR